MKDYSIGPFNLRLSYDGGNLIFDLSERTSYVVDDNGVNRFQTWTRGFLYIPAGNFISTTKLVVKCWLSAYDLALADESEKVVEDFLSDPNNLLAPFALPAPKAEPSKPNLN